MSLSHLSDFLAVTNTHAPTHTHTHTHTMRTWSQLHAKARADSKHLTGHPALRESYWNLESTNCVEFSLPSTNFQRFLSHFRRSYPINWLNYFILLGTRWRSCLKHCAASRKNAGSIPDSVTMALEFTRHLTEMRIRNISWGVKAAGAYGSQPYHLSRVDCLEIWDP